MDTVIIDFEGIDGVGKGLQSNILYNRLINEGHDCKYISFPAYGSFFGEMVGKYLNEAFGDLHSVPVEFPTLLYAMDRWKHFHDNKERHDIYIVDRYVPSNIAHQASKIPEKDRKVFIDWIMQLEYDILGIPKPEIVLVLDASPEITSRYILQKEARAYTHEKKDIHERDTTYLMEVRKVFLDLCKYKGFHLIKCDARDKLRPINNISTEIYDIVKNHIKL